MQILFSRALNEEELAFQQGSIDAGVSKALAHVHSLMMKVRKEPATEGACALFGKLVTMTFSSSFRPARAGCWSNDGKTPTLTLDVCFYVGCDE